MNYLSSSPFIRIVPAFCLGIFISFYGLTEYFIPAFLFATGFLGIVFFSFKRKPSYSYRRISGISIILVFISLGYFESEIYNPGIAGQAFYEIKDADYFLGRVLEVPAEKKSFIKTSVAINAVVQNGTPKKTTGRCYVLWNANNFAGNLLPGDEIIITRNPERIREPQNPGQFDYAHYASLKRITHQVYLWQDDWIQLPRRSGYNLMAIAARLRKSLLDSYRNAGLHGQEFAVLSALVLGYDDEIDQETLNAFSSSGTMHILSVSGMHVGIIFSALSFLLKFMEKRRHFRPLRLIFLIASLWLYAMVTGLSPSVIRSATMFSFIIIGRSMNRSSNIYNSLALSALCIFIFFDTRMLFTIGFQLSFIAVAGIAFLYPKIYALLYIPNKWLDKIWALISVSIAAQGATFAISLYYFHQFPNYFILANLLIIPLATITIFLGILLLFINPFPFVCIKAGLMVGAIVNALNLSASFIERIPGSVTSNISISVTETLIIYAILFSIVYYTERKKAASFMLLLIMCNLLLLSQVVRSIQMIRKHEMVVFSNTDSFSALVITGRKMHALFHRADSLRIHRYSDSYCMNAGLNKKDINYHNLDSVPFLIQKGGIAAGKGIIIIGNYFIRDMSIGNDDISTERIPDACFINVRPERSNLREIKANQLLLNSYKIDSILLDSLDKNFVNYHLMRNCSKQINLHILNVRQ